ncbi:MAG: hypothetical protein WB714_32960, partial [Candidatus Sulfotelmatobacter sp.]
MGKKLLQIDVGGQPALSAFRGTTDIALAPKGRIFISDGYANARILEYSADGKKPVSGSMQARVRGGSICRTRSWCMRTTSSMSRTAREGVLRNSTSTENSERNPELGEDVFAENGSKWDAMGEPPGSP